MAYLEREEIEGRTIEAIGKVLSVLPKIAAAVLGLTAIAYVEGWQYCNSFYDNLGASWAFDLLTTAQIMRSSADLLFLMALIASLCFFSLLKQTTTQHALGKWAFFFFCIAIIAIAISTNIGDLITTTNALHALTVAGLLLAICAAITLGELVAHLSDRRKTGHRYSVVLVGISLSLGVLGAPSLMGQSLASLDAGARGPIRLAQVTVGGTPDQIWYIVGAVGQQILLINHSESASQRRFKVVAPTDLTEIRPPARIK